MYYCIRIKKNTKEVKFMKRTNLKILISLITAFSLIAIIEHSIAINITKNTELLENNITNVQSGESAEEFNNSLVENDTKNIISGDFSSEETDNILSGDQLESDLSIEEFGELKSDSYDESGDNNKELSSVPKYVVQPPIVAVEIPNTHLIQTSDNAPFSGELFFGTPDTYNTIDGITTFRGNNYRDSAFYGTVDVNEKTLTKKWTQNIGKTDNWTGVGWNGQPSIVRWDKDIQKNMNLYDEFKTKEDLVEVIYGALDSQIHFYDLETGAPTRDTISVPSSIKGSVTIDPRGYPLLYVGQGIDAVSGKAVSMGYHIFSLIDGTELLFINGRDKYAYIGWGAFDGNPLIDSKNDVMILPGENGLVYIVKLNTAFDIENGTISISPDVTKYKTTINKKAGGIENAIAAYKNYGYFINNNGGMQCFNLNTLTPIWNLQMEDDCDATIGLEEENNTIMLYAGCEVDKRKQTAPSVVKKINGLTGEILWEYSCNCLYDSNVNGGLLSSPIIGKNDISDIVIFNFSKVTSLYNGKMVALNKSTGEAIWEKDLEKYSWSSPVAIYSTSGKSYIIFGNSIGQVMIIDPLTGETVYTLNTGGGNMEGSPAIFDNKIVIGTRGKKIYCIEIH